MLHSQAQAFPSLRKNKAPSLQGRGTRTPLRTVLHAGALDTCKNKRLRIDGQSGKLLRPVGPEHDAVALRVYTTRSGLGAVGPMVVFVAIC